MCVSVRVCRAADRTCSSLPWREQIVEFRGTWEPLDSCLIGGAYASLNIEICLCRGYLPICLLTSLGFFFLASHICCFLWLY